MLTVAGIDVSARKLDVACLKRGERPVLAEFEQSPAGHRRLATYLKKRQVKAIVMEATGIYYLDAAIELAGAGLTVSVVNPRAVHNFAKALLQRSKTDRMDACVLAEYALRMDLTPWQPPPEQWLALRDLSRRINQLKSMRVAEKNRLHAVQAKRHTAPALLADIQAHIESIDARIAQLTESAFALIQANSELRADYDCLISTTGIARTSAVSLLGELCLLPRTLRSGQLSCQAGLDVRLAESGSSVHRPGRLSKAGNAYLRAALHMPALSLVRHDPRAKAHYQALIVRGKKKMQALCAIQRKLLTALWACMKTSQPFDSSKLFAIEPENA